MKDKDNVLRRLDEAEDIARILTELAEKRAVDTNEAVLRLNEIRSRIKYAIDRVTIS